MKTVHLKGFSLIELVITISLLSIIISVAMPSYQNFIDKQALKHYVSELQFMLMTAKTESVTKNSSICLYYEESKNALRHVEEQRFITKHCESKKTLQTLPNSAFRNITIKPHSDDVKFEFNAADGRPNKRIKYSIYLKKNNQHHVQLTLSEFTGIINICSHKSDIYEAC